MLFVGSDAGARITVIARTGLRRKLTSACWVADIVLGACVAIDTLFLCAAGAFSINALVILRALRAVLACVAVELCVFAGSLGAAEVAFVECAEVAVLAEFLVYLKVPIIVDAVTYLNGEFRHADEHWIAAGRLAADKLIMLATARAVF